MGKIIVQYFPEVAIANAVAIMINMHVWKRLKLA